jgi:GH43 family beta-xylosidase
LLLLSAKLLVACGSDSARQSDRGEFFTNPVYSQIKNSTITFHDGDYYFVVAQGGVIYLRTSKDPVEIMRARRHEICNIRKDHNLFHAWRPRLANIGGVWYIYVAADDGNFDNHQIYVLKNSSEDPLEGCFEMIGRLSTDRDNNWAIHPCVFARGGELYMVWSGWETRRVFAETQCIFIARMENPWTLASERVLISRPQYEWECQWVNADGSTPTAYPLFVNESPTFMCNDLTDKAYIYYSASALWTPYTSIGELSADKDADFLDPASWSKKAVPVMKQERQAGIFGPGGPCVIPSPDGKEYYLLYTAKDVEIALPNQDARSVYMKKIEIGADGVPSLGKPAARGEAIRKPSGTEPKQ